MKTITIGKKFDCKHDFRETCFGIVTNKDKMLLVRKKEQFSFVGGGLEENESFLDCLKREFLEESGYTVKNIEELLCVNCFWLARDKWPMNTRCNVFKVEVDLNNFTKPTEEGHDVFWVPECEVLNLLPLPHHKYAMKYYLKNK